MTPPTLVPRANAPATLKSILEGDAFKAAVAKALPKHLPPDRFLRVAQTAMTRTPKLKECDQASFLGALLTLSALGLEPDGRRAHLIPFENRKRGCTECQLIVDYKGLVELAMRSGEVSNIHADVVCETDDFEFDRGILQKHKIDFRKPRGEVYAAYALCRFKDGGEKCEVMTREEVEGIRKRSRAGGNGPWVTDWNEMAKKTVFRRLSKWLPLSPEYRDALDHDADAPAEVNAPIPVFASVESGNFALPATTENDDGDLGPQKGGDENGGQEVNDTKAAPANQQTGQPSIKTQLADLVTGAGHSFDDFRAWIVESRNLTEIEAAAIGSFDEVPQAKAAFCVTNKTGMLKQLGMMKGVGK